MSGPERENHGDSRDRWLAETIGPDARSVASVKTATGRKAPEKQVAAVEPA